MFTTNLTSLILLSSFISIQFVFLLYSIINRRIIDIQNRSEVAVSLGILGTFSGIVIGLIGFNVNDIPGSVPTLLDGLKFAFITLR